VAPPERPARRAALLALGVLLADQGTKALVRANVAVGSQDPVLPAVKLVHVRNEGIAFGALSGGGTLVTVLVAVALVALLAFFVTHLRRPYAWLPVGLLLGGAVGNLLDRVRLGAVTDFVKLPAWPAFNLADVAITIGVVALVLVMWSDEDGDAADRGRG
jgi:signal peptidase II